MNTTHNNAYGIEDTRARKAHQGGMLRPAVVVCVLTLSGIQAEATVILNDTFSDGDHTTQGLPASAHWYSGGPGPNMSVGSDGLTFRDANSGKATALSYFLPTELKVGESLTLSFDYKFAQTATGDNDFMFGLFNSGGEFATKDSINFKKLADYTGYAASGVFGLDPSTEGRAHIEVRDNADADLLAISDYTVGSRHVQSGGATPGEYYTASMQISRTAGGITVESRIGNTEMVQTYSSAMFTKFDTVGIFSNGDTGSFTLDNVKLDYAGAPEPSALFAISLFGMAVFGKMFGRKAKEFFLRTA